MTSKIIEVQPVLGGTPIVDIPGRPKHYMDELYLSHSTNENLEELLQQFIALHKNSYEELYLSRHKVKHRNLSGKDHFFSLYALSGYKNGKFTPLTRTLDAYTVLLDLPDKNGSLVSKMNQLKEQINKSPVAKNAGATISQNLEFDIFLPVLDTITFPEAVAALINGKRISRKFWDNQPDSFLYFENGRISQENLDLVGDIVGKNTGSLFSLCPPGATTVYPSLRIMINGSKVTDYTFNNSDIIAADWYVLPDVNNDPDDDDNGGGMRRKVPEPML